MGRLTFLTYHSVAGCLPVELDLEHATFRRQLAFLAAARRVVSFDEALVLWREDRITDEIYVITFDDGYQDFYTRVFPLLCEMQMPATLFVTTGFVESGTPYPLMSVAVKDRRPQPVTWEMLGGDGRVGLGDTGSAHPHSSGLNRLKRPTG